MNDGNIPCAAAAAAVSADAVACVSGHTLIINIYISTSDGNGS